MPEIDRWALARTSRLIGKCLKGYEDYQFHQVYSALYNFCTVDLSSFYLDILKDRLYTHGTRSLTRRSAQTVLWHILDSFTRLMAPILPFTMEEVWKAMHEGKDKIESVHVEMFPVYQEKYDLAGGLEEWDQIISVREMVSKALEELRQSRTIGNSLEAKVVLRAGPAVFALLKRREEDLRYIFMVSQAELVEDRSLEAPDEVRVEVGRALGEKCERCWNYSPEVGRDAQFPTLCERCAPVVREML